jgi:predicted nucleotidyltransferase
MKTKSLNTAINSKLITINHMETANNTSEKVLVMLLKEPIETHTVTSIAKVLKITRQGLWKSLNKLEENKLIKLEKIGETKTGTTIIKLNWENPLTEKTLSIALTKESLKYERWRFNFKELENNIESLILFGSILHSPKEANDIDILVIVKDKNIKKVKSFILEAQKSQNKEIHSTNLIPTEMKQELKKSNKAIVDAVKKGIVLFGQENLISLIKEVKT